MSRSPPRPAVEAKCLGGRFDGRIIRAMPDEVATVCQLISGGHVLSRYRFSPVLNLFVLIEEEVS